MIECDSSDQAVSVVVVVVVVGVTFFSLHFQLLLSNHCTDFDEIWLKIVLLPLFFMELWVILCNFWPILKKSSIKLLIRNHSYLVWRVPLGCCDL